MSSACLRISSIHLGILQLSFTTIISVPINPPAVSSSYFKRSTMSPACSTSSMCERISSWVSSSNSTHQAHKASSDLHIVHVAFGNQFVRKFSQQLADGLLHPVPSEHPLPFHSIHQQIEVDSFLQIKLLVQSGYVRRIQFVQYLLNLSIILPLLVMMSLEMVHRVLSSVQSCLGEFRDLWIYDL